MNWNAPSLPAVLLATSAKPLWNGNPWRCSTTRVPPTPLPRMRPIRVRSPPHTTLLGASVTLIPVGSRLVTNVRSRLRALPLSFVATARKW